MYRFALFAVAALAELSMACTLATADDTFVCNNSTGEDRIAACSSLIGRNPRDAAAYNNRGNAYLDKGDYDRAIADYDQAIRIDRRFAKAYNNRGNSYWHKGNFDRAIVDLNQAIALDPKFPMAYNNRGLVWGDKGDQDRKIADLNQAILFDPTFALAYFNRGAAYQGKNDHDRAIEDFDQAIRINPKSMDSYNNRGHSYMMKGNFDRAIADFDQAITIEPENFRPYVNRGIAYEQKNDHNRAIADFDRAIALNPKYPYVHVLRAFTYKAKGDHSHAIADFEQAIKLDPKNVQVITAFADLQRERNQYDDCAESYSRAISLVPNPVKENWTIFYFRGICFERAKQWTKAEPDFKKALELFPDEPHVLNYLGYSWIDRGIHFDEGMRMIKRAVEQLPDDGYIVDSLGWAQFRLGDYDEALKNIERAVKLQPDDPTIRDHLGDVYRTLNRIAEARAEWSRSRDLNPEPEVLRSIEEKLKNNVATAATPANTPVTVPERRAALVIGNSQYRSVPALQNPRRDAKAVADALRQAGFQSVELAVDLDRDAMLNTLRSFRDQADSADWALVYFAGHGIEIERVNYLIPTDAKLIDDRDVKRETVSYEEVLSAISGARALRLVILDACRVNPFKERMRRTATSRDVKDRGLVAPPEMEPGTLVVYSAKDGEVAADDIDGVNSPFARALVAELKVPGREVRRLFDFVRDDVLEATSKRQQPFTYGSLPGKRDFYFVAGK